MTLEINKPNIFLFVNAGNDTKKFYVSLLKSQMMSLLCSKRSKAFPSHSIKIYCIGTSSHPQTSPFPTPLPTGPRLASRTGLPSDGLCTLLPQGFCTCCALYPLHSSPRAPYCGLSHFLQALALMTVLRETFFVYKHSPHPHTVSSSQFYFSPQHSSPSEAGGRRPPLLRLSPPRPADSPGCAAGPPAPCDSPAVPRSRAGICPPRGSCQPEFPESDTRTSRALALRSGRSNKLSRELQISRHHYRRGGVNELGAERLRKPSTDRIRRNVGCHLLVKAHCFI